MGDNSNTKYVASRPVDIKAVKRLLASRGERGWSVAELARSIGYTRGAVHNALVGHRKSSRVVAKIADALNVPVHKILTSTRRVPPSTDQTETE